MSLGYLICRHPEQAVLQQYVDEATAYCDILPLTMFYKGQGAMSLVHHLAPQQKQPL